MPISPSSVSLGERVLAWVTSALAPAPLGHLRLHLRQQLLLLRNHLGLLRNLLLQLQLPAARARRWRGRLWLLWLLTRRLCSTVNT